MHIGFILTKTPLEEGFKTFLSFVDIYIKEDEVSIYLLGNGVFCARKGHLNQGKIENILKNSTIYASTDDLKARGIQETDLIEGIKLFKDYDGMVMDIMENFDQVLSF